jgi:SH3 domain-containing YSC84-like protein 1
MRQLWSFVFLVGWSSVISAGQQVPPPPPPPPSQTTQASPSAQPGQPAAQTTAPAPAAQPAGEAVQQTTQQGTQAVQQGTQTVQQGAQTVQQTTEPAQTTTAPAAAPSQQTTTAPAQTTTAPPAAADQPTAPAQQTTTEPAAPAQQTTPDTTTPAAQQPTQPTVPVAPQQPPAQTQQTPRESQLNEQWRLQQEAARQEAIVNAQEQAQQAQQKAAKLKQEADKKQQEAQKEQAKANDLNQKAKNLQAGAPLPQSDQPPLTEAEFKREFIREREKSLSRLQDSQSVIRSFTTAKLRISADLLRKARCVVILPSTKKAAFVVGADYARGVMTCRLGENFDGPWSAPNMVALEGGSFGPQIGIQGTDWVLLVMNERGVDSLLKSKSKLGGDASVAAGPWGRAGQAATDVAMRAEILAFSHNHGIFLGASLIGSTLRPDKDANFGLYGRNFEPRDIVRSGEVRIPPEAVPLTNSLQVASTPPPPENKPQDQTKPEEKKDQDNKDNKQ